MTDARSFIGDAIARRSTMLAETLPRVLNEEDLEAVHDARVASRRLRAAIAASVGLFPPARYRKLHRLARSITRELGELRDREVLLNELNSMVLNAGPAEQIAILHWRSRIEKEHLAQRRAVRAFVEVTSLRPLTKAIPERFTERKPAITPDRRLSRLCRYTIADRVAEFYGLAVCVSDPAAIQAHHDLRIGAKRLRYTLELFAPLVDSSVEHMLDTVRYLQAILGDLHDTDVRIDLITAELAAVGLAWSGDPRDLGRAPTSFSDSAADRALAVSGFESLLAKHAARRTEQHAELVRRWDIAQASGLRGQLVALSALTTNGSDPDLGEAKR